MTGDQDKVKVEGLASDLFRFACQVDNREEEALLLEDPVEWQCHEDARTCQTVFREELRKLLKVLDRIEDIEARKVAYAALDGVILSASALAALVVPDPRSLDKQRQAEEQLRDRRRAVIERWARMGRMRPFVDSLAPRFASLPANKRVRAIRDNLLKDPEFCKILPKNLKDQRYLTADIGEIIELKKPLEVNDLMKSLAEHDSICDLSLVYGDRRLREKMEAIVLGDEDGIFVPHAPGTFVNEYTRRRVIPER